MLTIYGKKLEIRNNLGLIRGIDDKKCTYGGITCHLTWK